MGIANFRYGTENLNYSSAEWIASMILKRLLRFLRKWNLEHLMEIVPIAS